MVDYTSKCVTPIQHIGGTVHHLKLGVRFAGLAVIGNPQTNFEQFVLKRTLYT